MLFWIAGIIGTLGIAGTIAAAIMFPAVVIPVLEGIVKFILGCRACLIALSIVAAFFIGALYGSGIERSKCRAGELAAQLRNQQADLEAARKAAADEADRANTIEATANDQRSKDALYIATLEARPACALDDNDLGRLPNHKSRPGRKKPAAGAR